MVKKAVPVKNITDNENEDADVEVEEVTPAPRRRDARARYVSPSSSSLLISILLWSDDETVYLSRSQYRPGETGRLVQSWICYSIMDAWMRQ